MKEQIYTIPINEAFDEKTFCPLCQIQKRLEKEAVEYELGPAMMEPDHRVLSNEKGFCARHLGMMFEKSEKLPLSLVLDTHLKEVRKKLERLDTGKKKLFKGSDDKNEISSVLNSCVICEKLEKTMDRYARVLIDMWKDEREFTEKFENSKGFCLKHFEGLYSLSNSAEFKKALSEKELKELSSLQEDIHRFTLKFDYRNRDMEWGSAKDAPKRTVEALVGYINNENN